MTLARLPVAAPAYATSAFTYRRFRAWVWWRCCAWLQIDSGWHTLGSAGERGGVVRHVGLGVAWRPLVAFRWRSFRQLQWQAGHLVIVDRAQQVGDHVDAGSPLVVALDDVPRCFGDVSVDHHLVFRSRVLLPP